MNAKKIFRTVFTFLICTAIFFSSAFLYLKSELKKNKAADRKTESEPYYTVPTNSGMLFKLPSGGGCLVYLDFENLCIKSVFTENSNILRWGEFTVDYTVNADYPFIAGIIDRVGGICLESGGKQLRYTGALAVELLSETADTSDLERKILSGIFEAISKNGFSKDDFVYIIENGNTDLLVPDCFYWQEYMKEMAGSAEVN